MNRVVLSGGLLLLALAGCGGSKGAKSAADEHAEVGKPAPELQLETLNGKGKVSLDTLQGKVVVVDFWATWCAPCKQSFPKLEELSKRMGDKVAVVGVSCDEENKGIVEFAKENGASFAIGWDQGHELAQRWKVDNMPTTFILDGTRTVRHIHNGYHGDDEAKAIEKEVAALSEASASAPIAAKTEPKPEEKAEPPKEEPKPEAKPEPPPEDAEATPPKKKPGKKPGAKPASKKKPKKPTPT